MDSNYYYRKMDELYGLIYNYKLLIEMTRREKPTITKEDFDNMADELITNIKNIKKD